MDGPLLHRGSCFWVLDGNITSGWHPGQMWMQHQQAYSISNKTWNMDGACFLSMRVRGQKCRWELPGWFPERQALDQDLQVLLSAGAWYLHGSTHPDLIWPLQHITHLQSSPRKSLCCRSRRRKGTELQTAGERSRTAHHPNRRAGELYGQHTTRHACEIGDDNGNSGRFPGCSAPSTSSGRLLQ